MSAVWTPKHGDPIAVCDMEIPHIKAALSQADEWSECLAEEISELEAKDWLSERTTDLLERKRERLTYWENWVIEFRRELKKRNAN